METTTLATIYSCIIYAIYALHLFSGYLTSPFHFMVTAIIFITHVLLVCCGSLTWVCTLSDSNAYHLINLSNPKTLAN